MSNEWKKCTVRAEWDSWFLGQEQAEFLQSWDWGDFQNSVGRGVERWQLIKNNKVVFQAQVFEHKIKPLARYAYLPRHALASVEIIADLLDVLKNEKYSFARFEPGFSGDVKILNSNLIKNRQPEATMLLDLRKNSDEILAEMHAKTRYNIHLAEKKDITIVKKKDINVFFPLYEEMSKRDKIKGHTKRYLAEMLKMPNVEQFTAYFENEPIAANINIGFGDTYTYLHGASASKHRNLMAPYLLQWHCLTDAKKAGYSFYDFWGVAPELQEGGGRPVATFYNYSWAADNSWTGVTRFKAGFGGVAKKYGTAVDVPIRKIEYRLCKLAGKIIQFKNLKAKR